MRAICVSSSPKPAIACAAWNHIHSAASWPHKPLIGALAGALSFTFLISSPSSSMAVDSAVLQLQKESPLTEFCMEGEDDAVAEAEMAPAVVTNEGIVEEAWEIVNEGFLDTSNRWSPRQWLDKKEEILSSSIQTRTRAHDIIKRMLASLGDPYTRYLSPEQFSFSFHM